MPPESQYQTELRTRIKNLVTKLEIWEIEAVERGIDLEKISQAYVSHMDTLPAAYRKVIVPIVNKYQGRNKSKHDTNSPLEA